MDWFKLRHLLLAFAIVYLILQNLGFISSPDFPWILTLAVWLYFDIKRDIRDIRGDIRDIRGDIGDIRDNFAKHLVGHP